MFRTFRVLRGAVAAPQPVLRRKMGGGGHAPPPQGGLDGLVRKYLPENHQVWIYFMHLFTISHSPMTHLLTRGLLTHSVTYAFTLSIIHRLTHLLTHLLTYAYDEVTSALIYAHSLNYGLRTHSLTRLAFHGNYWYVRFLICVLQISIWRQEETSCSTCHRRSQSR